jgi:hypothetical protein
VAPQGVSPDHRVSPAPSGWLKKAGQWLLGRPDAPKSAEPVQKAPETPQKAPEPPQKAPEPYYPPEMAEMSDAELQAIIDASKTRSNPNADAAMRSIMQGGTKRRRGI